MIRLGEVLRQMDLFGNDGIPLSFQIKFVTANRNQHTGGEIIEIKEGRKCVGKKNGKIIFDKRVVTPEIQKINKDPHHWINSTRNILLPNGQIRKIHIRLIIEFNGQKVCF
jgi:hypothetical protein